MGETIRIELLGPLRIVADRSASEVSGQQRSILLCLLAIRPGRLLTRETLIQRSWPQGAPASAKAALRVHLAALRQLLGESGGDAIPHGRGGYRLDPTLVRTDLQEFDDLVAAAGDPVAGAASAGDAALAALDRLARIDRALALPRGAPFAGINDDDELRIEAERIEQVRQRLQEDRIDIRLALGQQVEVCAEAAALVAAAPLRERRTRQLMLALYRSGRPADALAAYRRLRDALVADLGVDPSSDTRELELRILRQDPTLTGGGLAGMSEPEPALVDPPRAGEPIAAPGSSALAVLERRRTGLSPRARQLVDLVAILDDAAWAPVVSTALDVSTATALVAFVEAREAGLVAASRDQRSWRLTRAQLREPVLHALTPRRRARLHTAAGRALAAYATQVPSALVPAAWHLALAARAGARPTASDELVVVQAVRHCLGTGQAPSAEALAAELLALPAAPSPSRVDLMTARVTALTMLGRTVEAHEQWEQSVASARAVGDPERLALAVLGRDWAQRSAQAPEGEDALLREALARLGERPSAIRVRLLAAVLLTLSTFQRGDAQVSSLAAEVEAEARLVGDPESLCAAMHVRHVLLRATPRLAERTALGQLFLRTAAETGDPWWHARATVALLSDLFAAGRYAEVTPAVDELRRCALEASATRLHWHHALVQSSLAREQGAFDEGDRWSTEAMLQGAAAGVPDTLGAAVLHKVLMAMFLADLVAFRPQIVHFRAMQPDNPLPHACLALSLAQSGELEAARAPFEQALRLLGEGLTEIGTLTLGILAETALALGARGEAHGIRAMLEPFDGLFLTFGQVTATLGPAGRYLGLLDWLEGDAAGALARLEAAQAAAARAGALPWVVRCAADRVLILRAVCDAAAAAALAREYAGDAARLGLAPCVAMFASDA